mgnify:CR=1 FL=1
MVLYYIMVYGIILYYGIWYYSVKNENFIASIPKGAQDVIFMPGYRLILNPKDVLSQSVNLGFPIAW